MYLTNTDPNGETNNSFHGISRSGGEGQVTRTLDLTNLATIFPYYLSMNPKLLAT